MNGPNSEVDQKNLFSALAISMAVLLIWQYVSPPPVPVEKIDTTVDNVAEVSSNASQPSGLKDQTATDLARAEEANIPRETISLDTSFQTVEISNYGGLASGWVVKDLQYAKISEDGSKVPLNLIDDSDSPSSEDGFLPPKLQLQINGEMVSPVFKMMRIAENSARLVWTHRPSGLVVKKTLTVGDDNYVLDSRVELELPENRPAVKYALGVVVSGVQDDSKTSGGMFTPPLHLYEALCRRDSDFERLLSTDLIDNPEDGDPNAFEDGIRWSGVGTRYFLSAVYSKDGRLKKCDNQLSQNKPGLSVFRTNIEIAEGVVAPGSEISSQWSLFVGPKQFSQLSAGDVNLEDAIDFGFFQVICKPMLWAMHIFFGLSPNWGIAIILLTVLVKLLTLPLTIKQYRSMAAMKTIQPELKAIQAKYKDDRLKLQQEMMQLYKTHQVNPLAGCLPMLMMMPIYFALYRTIYSAVELYQAPFAMWIEDLSAQDPFYITPVLLGVLMVIQMRLNPSAGDQMQQKVIMYVMPVMFTGMMLFLPSGLVLYILVNTVLGIVQQFYTYRQQRQAPAAS